MSAENIYKYLCSLESAISELETLLIDKEGTINELNIQLANAEMSILAARRENEDFAAKISRDAQRYIEIEVQARLDAAVNDRMDTLIKLERQKFDQELNAFKEQMALQMLADVSALTAQHVKNSEDKSSSARHPQTLKDAQKSKVQDDLFSQSWVGAGLPHGKSGKAANDESALILVGKLDSTIDKVQRLLREATG